ncbi:hypothetical protein KAT92_05515 [Candidatus Babeliales bacterium]|nr:hypothetical protein [Candidatus Babeliales bacterium]
METRTEALRKHLTAIGEGQSEFKIEAEEQYQSYNFVVNSRPHKFGSSPKEIVETVEIMRAKLITLFGEEARSWDSDFLRVQALNGQDLQPALAEARKRFETLAKALPMIKCEQVRGASRPVKHQLCRGMLDGNREFKVRVPHSSPIQRKKGRTQPQTWFAISRFVAVDRHRFHELLDDLEQAEARYERLRVKMGKLLTYSVLEPIIRDSFDWDRLGDKHDNETAHAYQEIVNPLYIISCGTQPSGEYQRQLRAIFDGKAIEDGREESTTNDGEYVVLTDEEAQLETTKSIVDYLWAFRSEFLAKWIPLPAVDIASMSESLCEDASKPFTLLIGDKLEDFVQAAIKADGRGHFLATYDGKEVKQDEYFIFRVN